MVLLQLALVAAGVTAAAAAAQGSGQAAVVCGEAYAPSMGHDAHHHVFMFQFGYGFVALS